MRTRSTLTAQELDLAVCLWFNRIHSRINWVRFLRAVSRLGDGPAWYALAAALPLRYGVSGLRTVAQMAIAAIAGLLLYKGIKRLTGRERPCRAHPRIVQAAVALDRYSFPSGHTLHAVSFAILGAHYLPALAAPLAAFAFLVALSRVVLGLHYPTDVAAGAFLGGGLACASLKIVESVAL